MANRTLGRYTLERKLATGGMAEIWVGHRAGPAGFKKDVVLKRILPHLAEDPKFVEMFLDEARLAAALSHPNIAQIFELGEADGDYFIAMEFVEGHDLQAILERAAEVGSRVPPSIAARIVADACTALDYAHNFRDREGRHARLVHRDVSPQNILVSRDGIVKLVDFGVAKAATSTHKTQTGAVKGKLSYMSPEQISGQSVDARSDIFSLGIVLYEAVTGRRPFGHESELLAITAILNEHPARPCEITGDLPTELEAIILQALEKSPADRFQSAAEMHAALERVLHGMGTLVTAREVSRFVDAIWEPGAPAAPVGVAPPSPAFALTHPLHPSAPTRPGSDAVERVPPPLHTSESTAAPANAPVRRPSRVPLIIAVLFTLALIGAGASWLYRTFGPTDAPPGEPSSVGASPSASTPTSSPPPATGADEGSGVQPGTAQELDGGVATDAEATLVGNGTASAEGTGEADPPSEAAAPSVPTDGAAGSNDEATAPEETNTQAELGSHDGDEDGAAVRGDAASAPAADDDEAAAPPSGTPEEAASDAVPDRPRTEPGTLRITFSSGGAHDIFIDGRAVGSYPGRTRFEVPAGTRTVRVVSSGGSEHSETVEVRGGRTVMVRVP